MKVFIVCGEFGEYEQTCFGLCGVFATKAEAEGYATVLRDGRDAYSAWYDLLCREINVRRPPIWTPFDSAKHGLIEAEARKHVPPEPEHFMAERVGIVEVEIGELVKWISVDVE